MTPEETHDIVQSNLPKEFSSVKKKKNNHYINNKKFLDEIIKYRESINYAKANNLPEPKFPNYIGECFMFIANNLAKKSNFAMYSFVEEMKSDAIENCLLYFHNFDPNKSSNPFSYFTQFTYFAFIRRIKKEKKELYVKYKAIEDFGVLSGQEMYEDVDGNMKPFEMYDNIAEYIRKYEESMVAQNLKKPTTKKPKGLEKFFDGADCSDFSDDISEDSLEDDGVNIDDFEFPKLNIQLDVKELEEDLYDEPPKSF